MNTLSPDEIITNDTLRHLASGDADRQQGDISAEDQAILAMILPDLCGELISRRAVMQMEETGSKPRSHAEEIADAMRSHYAHNGTI